MREICTSGSTRGEGATPIGANLASRYIAHLKAALSWWLREAGTRKTPGVDEVSDRGDATNSLNKVGLEPNHFTP